MTVAEAGDAGRRLADRDRDAVRPPSVEQGGDRRFVGRVRKPSHAQATCLLADTNSDDAQLARVASSCAMARRRSSATSPC
jgi:hypothetical protein